MNIVKIIVRRRQTTSADQRHQLPGRDKERDRVNKAEQPQDDESRQPVRTSAREKFSDRAFVIHHAREIKNCQGGELNSRPRAYESPALPLSYPGE